MDSSGILYINDTHNCLDYEIRPVHTLLVQASDGTPFSHTSRALIMINLKDRDNKPPEFYWKTYTAAIKENMKVGSSVVKVGASDPDSTNLIYAAVNFTDEFEFQQNMLVTKKELDAEVHQRYMVNISVTDGTNGHDYATVEVLVEDVNDNVPFFTSSLKNFSIPANALGNRRVGQLTAKDKDISNGGFTFYLANEDHFRIDNSTGELFVMDDHIKFQANVEYNMTVNVMDHGQPPLTTSAEINIFIDITNHNPPYFLNEPYSNSLKENANINSSVIIVKAKDKDPGDAGIVWYKLVPNSKYDGKFHINENSGEITLVGKLDYEGVQHYELTVLAIDKADDPKTATTHVQIYITNVNEKPQFLEKLDGLCVKSPITRDQLVAIVNARDPDKNDVLSYSLNDTRHFRIGNESGEIRAKLEVASNLTISVIVKDKGGLMDTKEIELYNNPSLVITPAIITVDVTENSTDHYITKVNASSKQTLSYTLFNSTGFTIDSNGTITSDGPLDRETETKKITVIHVQVNSSSSSCLAQVNINIQDINDNPPRFGFQYDTKTIPENLSTGTCFFPLPVEDPDLNTKLNFSIIEDDSHGKFEIQPYSNQTGGCLVLKTSLDYESMPDNLNGLYSLKAEVSDGKYSSTREIKVHIQDINDNDPIFNQTQYYAEISENVPQFTSIIHMTAYDRDALDDGKLKYSLEGDDSMYFIIQNNSHFGDLEVNTELNRENRSSYTVTVIAHDSDGHTGSTNVSITVLDVNEFKPKFNKDSYLFTTYEGPSSKGFDMVVSTSDPDLGENGTNSFTLINDYGGLFNITTLPNNTGVITVLKELDRESQNSQKENGTAVYRLHVKALDHGIPAKSEVTVVILHVEDINDCKPQFTQPHYHAEVLEGSHKGFSILTVTATDCDYLDQYNNITFSLTGKDSDLFEINNSGEIHLNTTISVQSHKDKFNLTIVATDSANTNQVPLTVSITDVNDHDPVFTHPIYNFSTPETDGTGDIVVGSVSATDEDLGQNGVVTYSIISIDVQHVFNISQDGTITVIGELDRDQCISNRYPFTVIARDNGSSKRTGYTEVIVYVTDINDNSPVFTENWYNGTVLENSPDDTEVNILPPISSTDSDSGQNGTKGIRYSIIGTDLPFDINDITGAVFTNGSGLDRESQSDYTIQVKAADRYGSGNSNVVMVTITLLDINDEPPQFTKNNYIFSVNESAAAGQKVGVVMATDEDVNGNTTTRYRIGAGSDGKFYVDILSGVIYTSGGLDREKKARYELNIEAFDGQQKTNSTVTVYIEDANDNCPVFKPQKLVVKVPENTQNASVVYNLTATDIDQGENAAVSFYLNSSDTSPFIISGDYLILDGTLDREIKDEYTVKIYAKDNGIPACVVSSYLEVHVEDINDNSPIFYNADGSIIYQADATIIEKSPVGSPILLPSVKDNDIGENAEVEFSLSAEKPDILKYFGISKKTGVVTIKAQVDLNSLNRLHVLDKNATKTAALEMWVVATDKGKPKMSSALNLTVTVEGINDQAPVFLSPEYDYTIPENVTIGSVVGTVEAIVENGTNHKLHYSLIPNSESNEFFRVAEISGNITTLATIDREKTPAFHFAVQVKDGKIPERTAYTMVTVTVTDVNDNHPEFKQRSYEYIIEENIISPGIFVTATDADSGLNGNVSYSLVRNPGNQFLLNEQTGMLNVNGTLDREEKTCYNLSVLAVDHGINPLTSSVLVIVTVTDQNDNAPKFTTNNRTYYVKENQHPGQLVCDIKAEDPDHGVNGSVIYMFSGNTYPQFNIEPMSGKITTLVSLDYEVKSVYNLTVVAMDLGTPSLNSTFDLTVMVQDVYDTAPQFTRSLYERTIDVNTPTSTVILGVTAGQYIKDYKIEDGNSGNHFDINPASGVITLSSRLGTSVLEYKLNISATDHIQTKYTQVLIHVTTSFVQMKNNTFTATIPENMNTTTQLIDLNYTDGSNTVFSYQIIQIIPDVLDTFRLNQTTGELYCIKQLDREDINQYTFYIRAVPSSNRVKRSVKDSPGDIKVVVYVQDENDNSPRFSAGPVLTMGVSDTTSVGDLVTTLKAEDVDIGDTIQYQINGGQDKDSFSIENSTGKIYSRIKVDTGKTYTVIVTADDGKFSTDITVKFLVISSSDKVVLTIPIALPEFESKSKTIMRNISHIVGFKVELEKSGVHVDSKTHLDWSKTDIYFHGINETGGFILPQQTSFRIIHEKSKEIASLFSPPEIKVITYHSPLVPHKMSEAEIALLTIGVVILVSSLLALIAANYTWKQFKRSHTTAKDKQWELNSINSSHANGSVVMRQNDNGYINPAFTETRFTEREDQLPATNVIESETVRRKREYESQEVVLDLPLEPIDAGLQPPAIDGAREMSLNGYDSGLENEIDSTSSASGNAEDALQDKEIRIETVVEGSEKGDNDNTIGAGPSHGQEVFTFDMETGDTDDDIDDDEVEDNGIKRRKSSKKKFNRVMTVFPSKIEASDTDTDDNPDQSSSHKHLSRKTDSELEGSQDRKSGEIISTKEDSNSDLKQKVKFETLPDQNEQIYKAENEEKEEEGEIEITSF
ncbi:protocadherin Fat 4-like [Mytilus trossulus]|uniref:protocadherin Fat 4-like n=1 Tax=Mytilus trossulus TaxID=6551 RepID=UPI003007264E